MAESVMETWETTTAGGVWIYTVDTRGVERPKRIKGPAGYRFKVSPADREASGARFVNPATEDPFCNGVFRRIDAPVEKVVEQIPEYDAEQALSNDDLVALFSSSGMAFRSKVGKLNERNQRRLADLAGFHPDIVSQAQQAYLDEVLAAYKPSPVDPDPQA